MDFDNQPPSAGERHIYTQELIKLLQRATSGQIVKYEDMDGAIGIHTRPGQSGYAYQYSARLILERDESIVFEVVNKIGLKRLPAEDVAKSTVAIYLARKKSSVARYTRRISAVNDEYEGLSEEAKMKTNLCRTLLAFDKKMSKTKKITTIENKIKQSANLLDFNETIKLFSE